MKTVRLELLLGKLVRDSEGAKVGRLFEVHAEMEGEDCVVREYELGAYGLLVRFGISFGRRKPLRVPWDQLDLADPEHPRLRCRRDELPS
jgi:sporulation protein YlmC with PRC-barrel domain